MNKTSILLFVVGATVGVLGAITCQANRPEAPVARSLASEPMQLRRVNCTDGSSLLQHQLSPAACLYALDRYLMDHPQDRVVGVFPVEPPSERTATTAFVVLLSATHGRLARDLTVDEACDHMSGDCLTAIGKLTVHDANVLSWLVVNGTEGIDSILRLQVRSTSPFLGSWEDDRFGAQ